ncbi:MAG: dihydroorotase [Candidatus Omnitrophica bacterium]|nr:dihydroorotase [Candidatus Omnitrophota bacterium]
MKILIKNGLVVDPANKLNEISDILVEDFKISKIAKNLKVQADQIVDATEKIVMPGLVDMHVHLREPGREDKETISTGTSAALKGGVTSVLAMPNTHPAIDSKEAMGLLKDIIKKTAHTNVFISATITKGRQGQALADIPMFKKQGAVAISDDGSSVDTEDLFLKALKKAKDTDILTICHCEDKGLSRNGVINLGVVSTRLGLRGVSRESEYKRVERDIRLAAKVGARIHIAHVSCLESVDIIARARQKGIKVTAETAPHYFALTEEEVLDYNTNMKVNPPLRTKKDAEAIKEGLRKGIIDVIASDHAPHTDNEKDIEFERAEFGTIGLETLLAVSITELVDKRILDWTELVKKLALNPAQILGIDKGTIRAAKTADLIVVSPDREWLVDKDSIRSKSRNSAFLGRKLKGIVEYTILGGEIVYAASK